MRRGLRALPNLDSREGKSREGCEEVSELPYLDSREGKSREGCEEVSELPPPPQESHCTKGTQFDTWVLRVDIIELDLISRIKTLISRIKTLISRIMTLISRIRTMISRTLLALPYWPLSWVFQDVKAPKTLSLPFHLPGMVERGFSGDFPLNNMCM